MSTQPGAPAEGRMFTQGEAYALVDDGIKRETAARDDKIASLEREKAELQTKVDTLETEKTAEAQRADEAVKAFEDYKTEQEANRQIAERAESRKKELAEANPFLELTEERVARVAAMSDEAYTTYLSEMREVAEKAKAAGSKVEPPKAPEGSTQQTAAFLPGGGDDKSKSGTVLGLFGARAGVTKSA